MTLIRLDKFLSNSGYGTRSEIKALINKGKVSIDKIIIKDPAFKVDENISGIEINGKAVTYNKYVYIMLNKPANVVSAVTDKEHKTVIDLVEEYKQRDIFPVGRLDKDTTGLLILTNNGDFSHNTLSPKKHIDKTYYFECEGILDPTAVDKIKNGIIIDKNYKCKPALLNILKYKDNVTYGEIVISEGKFHQVKKMIACVGGKITRLKRIKFGEITLDEKLKEGEYRPLNNKEMEFVREILKGS